jgi:hypothetical protein
VRLCSKTENSKSAIKLLQVVLASAPTAKTRVSASKHAQRTAPPTAVSALYALLRLLLVLGRYLVRLCDLVGAPRGRPGPFFRFTGRGGHLGGPTTKWGGRGRPAGHAAVPPAVPRWPLPLAGLRGPFFSRGVITSEISG